MKKDPFAELSSLFFSTRQIIRSKLPGGKADPNTWQRFEVLRYVDSVDQATMHDVTKFMCVRAPTATSLIRHMIALGYLVRQTSKKDKRVVNVRLTSKGKRELRHFVKNSSITMRRVFEKLGKQDVEKLARILRRLQEIHE